MEKTPFLGLNKPAKGSLDWNVPLNQNFEIIDSWLYNNARIGTLNKGYTTPKTVTETVLTLKQEVTPDNNFITFVDSIHVIANNPSGSGVTLYFMLRVVLSNDSEVDLLDAEESVAEGESFDDVLIDVMEAIPTNEKIKAVRLYAYCSAAPNSDYEPTVQLEKVTGVQN